MQATTTIGLDIAKSVFQVHGIDAEGNVTLRRRVKRRYVLAFFQKLPPCLVGIEACASYRRIISRREKQQAFN
jgi:transposase